MATQAATSGVQTAETKDTVQISKMDRELGAAFLSSGIGTLALGLTIIVTEMKAAVSIKNALNWVNPVGPLSGKTGIALIAFVISWVVLYFVFKNRPIKLTLSFTISLVLIALGLLMSFPPFFDLFAK